MISVLLPVYNTNPEHLVECLESIMLQTFNDFEVVLVNNGSTDWNTLTTISLLRNHKKIKIIDCPRQSGKKNLSVALNTGLKECAYEYIARMDSDDVMNPERLSKQFNCMKENPHIDILGTQLKNMNSKQVTSHPEYIPQFYYKVSTFFLCHPTVMFKKNKILEIGGYQETPDHIPEDYLLWVKALKAGLQIYNLQEVLVLYRDKGFGLSDIDSKRPEWYEAIGKAMRE
jgi:glycosyltransferase involved in cell wall biosynthesis